MPTKTEFKFNCSACGQHILAATEWSGRRITCPSCQTRITIPEPPKEARKPALMMPPNPITHPKQANRLIRVEAPGKESKAATAQTEVAPASPKVRPAGPELKAKAPSTTAAQPQQRVAALTPAIKLDLVRAVRRRISEESAWLPGKLNGKNAYAAKIADGETVLVDVKSPEASRFSLIGAFLLEFHVRRVARTATGRTKFLDQEIPDAVREALLDEMSEEDRGQTEDPLSTRDLLSISHSQCLAALDVLEEGYSQRMEQVRIEKAKGRLGKVRLSDLVKKLERKARVAPEDVATALYHELAEVRRRLERLESRITPSHEATRGKVP